MKHYTEYKWENTEACAHKYVVPKILKIIRELKLTREAKILDAGCGGGSLVHILLNHLGFKNVYGFDASESGIKIARKSFPELKKNFFMHNAYESKLLPDVPQKYDLIISMEVIEHLYSPETYLRNINLWVKDNGYLILTTPYHGYLKNVLVAMLNKHDKHFNPLWEGGHIKFFSKKTLFKTITESGFKLLRFYGSGRLPYLWKSIIVVAHKV